MRLRPAGEYAVTAVLANNVLYLLRLIIQLMHQILAKLGP